MAITGSTKGNREADVAAMVKLAMHETKTVRFQAVGVTGSEILFHAFPDGDRREYRLRVEEV